MIYPQSERRDTSNNSCTARYNETFFKHRFRLIVNYDPSTSQTVFDFGFLTVSKNEKHVIIIVTAIRFAETAQLYNNSLTRCRVRLAKSVSNTRARVNRNTYPNRILFDLMIPFHTTKLTARTRTKRKLTV